MGTASSSLNLNQNPCAKALWIAAGDTLQDECNKKRPVNPGDITVLNYNQTGDLKCVVIFAICSPWNGGKGKEVI